jgi:hypothetical protein
VIHASQGIGDGRLAKGVDNWKSPGRIKRVSESANELGDLQAVKLLWGNKPIEI